MGGLLSEFWKKRLITESVHFFPPYFTQLGYPGRAWPGEGATLEGRASCEEAHRRAQVLADQGRRRERSSESGPSHHWQVGSQRCTLANCTMHFHPQLNSRTDWCGEKWKSFLWILAALRKVQKSLPFLATSRSEPETRTRYLSDPFATSIRLII